jgi:hypothetical protein
MIVTFLEFCNFYSPYFKLVKKFFNTVNVNSMHVNGKGNYSF